MTMARARLALSLAGSIALLAGCGSSGSSSSSASNPASSTNESAATSTAAAASNRARTVEITTKHSKLGTILAAGDKQMTVYLFEGDKNGTSSCSGGCAVAWPPVLGMPKPAGGALTSNLGTVKRAGGATQVTYKGHPLYYFIKDKDDGDAYGEGVHAFGADWYVLNSNGHKIDES